MRCLNCNTIVADSDPRCPSCGAKCTMTVSEQDSARSASGRVAMLIIALICFAIAGYQALESYLILTTYARTSGRLVKKEFVQLRRSTACIGTIDFVGPNGQTFQAEVGGVREVPIGSRVGVLYKRSNPNNNRADDTSALWGYPLAIGGIGCLFLIIWMFTSTPEDRPWAAAREADKASPSLASAFARPVATSHWQSPHRPVQVNHAPAGRSGIVRILCGFVWVVVIVFLSGGTAATISTWGAGGDPELRKQLASEAGQTIGPPVIFGSMTVAFVLGCMGLLPGTGRKKR